MLLFGYSYKCYYLKECIRVKKKINISESEWYIMNVLWDNEGLELKEITNKLMDNTNWKSATIRTMLLRLINKGFVKADTSTGVYKYFAIIDKENCVKEEAKSFLDRIYKGSISQFISSFAKSGDISEKEKNEILEIISSMEDNND